MSACVLLGLRASCREHTHTQAPFTTFSKLNLNHKDGRLQQPSYSYVHFYPQSPAITDTLVCSPLKYVHMNYWEQSAHTPAAETALVATQTEGSCSILLTFDLQEERLTTETLSLGGSRRRRRRRSGEIIVT